MKKYMIALFGTAFLLGACGGNDNVNDVNEAPADNGNNAEEATGDYDLAQGEELFAAQCAGCHGGDLAGASAPGIQGKSYDEVMDAIQNGPGTMQSDIVTGDEAENVAAWVSEQ